MKSVSVFKDWFVCGKMSGRMSGRRAYRSIILNTQISLFKNLIQYIVVSTGNE